MTGRFKKLERRIDILEQQKVQALDQLTSCEEAQIDALIDRLCKLPTWRNTSEAITKLEEANLWLKAGPASRKKFRDGMQAYQG